MSSWVFRIRTICKELERKLAANLSLSLSLSLSSRTPTWLSLSTSAPQNSSRFARQSPMMVERRWPTCISLATFGEEKSTTARDTPAGRLGAQVEGPSTSMAPSRAASASLESLMLMNPGPASEGGLEASRSGEPAGSAATIFAATSRGALGAPSFPFSLPKTPMALLHW